MSRFLSSETKGLEPYTPGEQPQDMKYIKLNTNESPFPPSPMVIKALAEAGADRLNLYPDPACAALRAAIAREYFVGSENVTVGNGSDELLGFAFRAFCGAGIPAIYADVTYGFYSVWAALCGIKSAVVPLREDFSLSVDDYIGRKGTVFIANPNAPTGLGLAASEVERILRADRDRVVVIDEAYADFGGESCIPLINEYDNLIVMRTFSKSRSLAGGRIGFAIGCRELITDINRVKFSFNPYNVNSLSATAGRAAMEDREYFLSCRTEIIKNRDFTSDALEDLGFTVLPSLANFVFARSDRVSGGKFYSELKSRGVLVRHFDAPRISDLCRITVGSEAQMRGFIDAAKDILEGKSR